MASPLDYLMGLGETGATLGTGAISGLLGMPYGLYKGVTSGKYGTPQGVKIAEQEAANFMARNTYQPRTAQGQQNLQQLAGLLESSKLPPVIPEAALLGQIPRQAYATQAERAGMAAERALEPVVQRTMQRGGKGAQLLQDLSQGSQSKMYVPATQQEAFEAAKKLRTKSPREVWNEMGVAKFGNDYVKELSDKDAKAAFTHLEGVNGGERLQQYAFEHPELYALIPELKDIGQLGLKENRMSGSYSRVGEGKLLTGYAPTEKDLKTVMAHEMQHGIQDIYGWERGGSIKDIGLDISENKLKAQDIASKLERLQNKASDEARFADADLVKQATDWANKTSPDWYANADKNLIVKDYLLSTDPNYTSLYQTHSDLLYNKPALLGPEETYKRLAGEVQARSTQNRVDLTPEERRQYFPFELKSEQNPYGLDVSPEDLLFRSGGGLLGR